MKNSLVMLYSICWAGGEIEYTLGLGPSAARRGGASPLLPTDAKRLGLEQCAFAHCVESLQGAHRSSHLLLFALKPNATSED